MARSEISTVAPGVTGHEFWWGYYVKGTKEALIAAGFAQPVWFPDGIARNKKGQIIRQRYVQVSGFHEVKCQQQSVRQFHISFSYSEEERERRYQAFFDARSRARKVAEIKGKTAKADPDIQALLANVLPKQD